MLPENRIPNHLGVSLREHFLESAGLGRAAKKAGRLPAGHPFAGVQSSYCWSGTTEASFTAGAWMVRVDAGFVSGGYETSTASVWPVRSGQ